MFNDESSKQICKIGGPFILLVCLPAVIWALYSMIQKESLAGNPLTTKVIVQMGLFVLALIFGGLFFTYKGYEDKFRK